MSRYQTVFLFTGILLLSLLMHLPVFKKDLVGYHVWRQTETQTVTNAYARDRVNFAEPHRNDLSEKNGLHVREFPLMQWCFAQVERNAAKPFVVSRILSFIISCFTLWGIFLLVKGLTRNTFIGLLGAWMLAFSPVFYYYAVNPLSDNLALCLSVFCLLFSFRWGKTQSFTSFLLALLFLSLAILIKLPFVLTGGVLLYFACLRLFKREPAQQKILIVVTGLVALLPPFLWYSYSIPHWNGVGAQNGILDKSFSLSGSANIFFHNLVSTLPELLVNYAALPVFLAGIFFFFKIKSKSQVKKALVLQFILLAGYFVFEHNMIAKVHDYYLFPFLPLIVFIGTYGLLNLSSLAPRWVKTIAMAGVLFMPVTAYLRIQTRWNEISPGFSAGFYQYKNEIRKLLPAKALCITGEDESGFIQLYYLDRKGWSFNNRNFDPEHFKTWKERGATHFVTSSQNDTAGWIQNNLDEKIFDKGGINIYTIKP